MLSGSRLKTMLGVVHRAAVPIETRATRKAMLGWEAVSRTLAATTAADVAGYSRLMEADEGRNARASQKRAPRSELHKRRTLETTGDGMLIEFAKAVQAVRIAAG
jgi:hypothetical protein